VRCPVRYFDEMEDIIRDISMHFESYEARRHNTQHNTTQHSTTLQCIYPSICLSVTFVVVLELLVCYDPVPGPVVPGAHEVPCRLLHCLLA
jgi:hypothetical protein